MNVTYDTTGHFSETLGNKIVMHCAVVVAWAQAAEGIDMPVMKVIEANYGYPLMESKGGKIIDGVYNYPEDPPLYPLCRITTKLEEILFYEYDMIAIKSRVATDGDWYVTRVD